MGRILVVEDDFLIAMASGEDLRGAGHEVIGAVATAEAAIACAKSAQPDLVVMDIRLAGAADGVDAALEIFKETRIRSLFTTAHVDSRSKVRAASAEPLGWLQKPYGKETLLEAVRTSLAELGIK